MSDDDNGFDAAEPTHYRPGDEHLNWFTMDGQTVLFDVYDADRWIKSDTTVQLADTV